MEQSNGGATASLVLGILSIILAFLISWAGLICGIVGLVLGVRARHVSGVGKAGFVTSIIGLVLSAILIVLALFVAGALLSGLAQYGYDLF